MHTFSTSSGMWIASCFVDSDTSVSAIGIELAVVAALPLFATVPTSTMIVDSDTGISVIGIALAVVAALPLYAT
jgi:hypothetical protein